MNSRNLKSARQKPSNVNSMIYSLLISVCIFNPLSLCICLFQMLLLPKLVKLLDNGWYDNQKRYFCHKLPQFISCTSFWTNCKLRRASQFTILWAEIICARHQESMFHVRISILVFTFDCGISIDNGSSRAWIIRCFVRTGISYIRYLCELLSRMYNPISCQIASSTH